MGYYPGALALQKAALFFVGLLAAGSLAAGCGGKPIASVNGQTLTEEEFARLCETATEINPQQGTVGRQVLVQWIRNTVLTQEAKRLKVYPAEAELNARVESYRKQAAFAGGDFDQQLGQQGLTIATFKRELLNGLITESIVSRGVNVTDDEVRKKFEAEKPRMTQPEQIQISQITVDSDAKRKQVQGDLAANTQFPLVASTHSKDGFTAQGGQVPFPLGRKAMPGGPVDQKVIDAAFKLKEGQMSDPIKVGANWVFAKLEKRIAEKQPNFDDVKEIMRSFLRREKAQTSGVAQEAQRALLVAFQKADVKVNRAEYQSILNQVKVPTGAGGAPPAVGGSPNVPPLPPAGSGGGAVSPPPPPGK